MRKDGQRASDPEVQFVWELPGGTAGAPQAQAQAQTRTKAPVPAPTATPAPTASAAVSASAVQQRSVLHRRRNLLIGSGAFVLVVGAAFGAGALSTQQHHDTATAGTAAMALPSSLFPTQHGAAATTPTSPSAGPSRSATPSKTHPAAAAPKNTAAAQTLTSVSAQGGGGSAVNPAAASAPAVAASKAQPAAPAPTGNWLLNQTVGNVAVDSTGGHNGWAQDGWWNAGDGCLFNGTNSQIYTSGPVLSTGAGDSFTVSAWVDMTALPASGQYDETAVSQDGGVNSGFYLQYTEPADRWAFSRTNNNTDDPTAYRALSASAPALDTWTHLVGVYNAANHTQYLYVNGAEQGTATDSTPYAATGDLAIGRAQYAGQDTDWLKGAIKGVEVFNTALSSAQVSALN